MQLQATTKGNNMQLTAIGCIIKIKQLSPLLSYKVKDKPGQTINEVRTTYIKELR